jgi:hypothetical protein
MKRIIYILLLLCFVPFVSRAAISFDNATSVQGLVTGGNCNALAGFCDNYVSSGANLLYLIYAHSSAVGTGCTVNGSNCTPLFTSFQQANNYYLNGWYYATTTAGNASITMTFSSAFFGAYAVETLTGVNQASPIDAMATATAALASSMTLSTSTITNKDWLSGFFSNMPPASVTENLTGGANTTVRASSGDFTNGLESGVTDSNGAQSIGSHSQIGNWTDAQGNLGGFMVAVKPAGTTNKDALFYVSD